MSSHQSYPNSHGPYPAGSAAQPAYQPAPQWYPPSAQHAGMPTGVQGGGHPGATYGPGPGRPGRGRSGRLITGLVAGVLGIVIGLGGGWLLMGGDEPELSSAEADAAHGCRLARDLPAEIVLLELGGLEEDPTWYRTGALTELMDAAAVDDQRFSDLAEHAAEIHAGIVFSDEDQLNAGLSSVRTECDVLQL